ncbi:MAG: 50S ribosomal protein L21e [Candidatus Bathyarchaeota archaeon]|nr:MAG: 50S ribosomal protein L21e [Candidatus Bathyarchaeota archaeon]
MGKSRGPRRKSRSVLTKRVREKGKLGLSRLLAEYEVGQKVVINIDPAIHKGMPHKRFQGKVGTVVEKRGKSYVLDIPQRKTSKYIIARPEHIKSQ